MLHFRGSDYKRSQVSTWYDKMESLLMDLGFIESKEDSNLFSNFEGKIPMMLLLYLNNLFLKEKRNSLKLQEGDLLSCSR